MLKYREEDGGMRGVCGMSYKRRLGRFIDMRNAQAPLALGCVAVEATQYPGSLLAGLEDLVFTASLCARGGSGSSATTLAQLSMQVTQTRSQLKRRNRHISR